MIERLIHWDQTFFLFLNGQHTPLLDFVMYWLSDKIIWIPLYLFFLFLLWRKYRKQTWLLLLFILVLIVLSDQISSGLIKNLVQRLRPCHEPLLQGMVHLVKGKCGGDYGFVSSHACNTFALAVMLGKLLGKYIKWFSPFILGWATLISYSRIYLGVHYPGDVLAGAGCGCLIALLLYRVYVEVRKIQSKS